MDLGQFKEGYQKIIEPHFLVAEFKSDAEFLEWAMIGTVEDIKATIEVFKDNFLDNYIPLLEYAIKEHKAQLQ